MMLWRISKQRKQDKPFRFLCLYLISSVPILFYEVQFIKCDEYILLPQNMPR